jgi:hypothetical protein
MIKKLIIATLLMALASVAFATENFPLRENEFGLTMKYDPLAGTFGRTIDGWSYEQESLMVGMYGYLWLNDDTTLLVKSGIIPGSNDIGDNIGIVGTSANISLSFGDILQFNYGVSYYWGGKNMSYMYDMCTGVVHKADVQIYIPLSGRTELE